MLVTHYTRLGETPSYVKKVTRKTPVGTDRTARIAARRKQHAAVMGALLAASAANKSRAVAVTEAAQAGVNAGMAKDIATKLANSLAIRGRTMVIGKAFAAAIRAGTPLAQVLAAVKAALIKEKFSAAEAQAIVEQLSARAAKLQAAAAKTKAVTERQAAIRAARLKGKIQTVLRKPGQRTGTFYYAVPKAASTPTPPIAGFGAVAPQTSGTHTLEEATGTEPKAGYVTIDPAMFKIAVGLAPAATVPTPTTPTTPTKYPAGSFQWLSSKDGLWHVAIPKGATLGASGLGEVTHTIALVSPTKIAGLLEKTEAEGKAATTPLYKKWWFWTAIAGSVATLGTGGYLAFRRK